MTDEQLALLCKRAQHIVRHQANLPAMNEGAAIAVVLEHLIAQADRSGLRRVYIAVWVDDGEPNCQAFHTRDAAVRDFPGETVIESTVQP